jgi:hypothetical protein
VRLRFSRTFRIPSATHYSNRERPWNQTLATRQGAQAPYIKRAAQEEVSCRCDEGSRSKEPSANSEEVRQSKGSTGCHCGGTDESSCSDSCGCRSLPLLLSLPCRSLFLLLVLLTFSFVALSRSLACPSRFLFSVGDAIGAVVGRLPLSLGFSCIEDSVFSRSKIPYLVYKYC